GEAERVTIQRNFERQVTDSQRRLQEDVRLHGGDVGYMVTRQAQEMFNLSSIALRTGQSLTDADYREMIRQRNLRGSVQDFQAGMMDRMMNLPGTVATPEMRELQYKIQQRMFERDERNQIADFLKANPDQGGAADAMRASLDQYMKSALSPEVMRR